MTLCSLHIDVILQGIEPIDIIRLIKWKLSAECIGISHEDPSVTSPILQQILNDSRPVEHWVFARINGIHSKYEYLV